MTAAVCRPGTAERGWRPPRRGGSFTVALAYPNTYRAGMSSLGFQTVLYGFAAIPGVVAERVFLPERGPGLQVLDAGVPPARADLLAFSVAYENDYPNILRILAAAGMPLRASERHNGPLVLAGGIAPTLNPEPLAPFVDLVAVGEGEELLGPLVEIIRGGDAARGRERLVEAAAALPGLYIPALYEPSYAADGTINTVDVRTPAPPRVARAWVRKIDDHPAVSRIHAPGSRFEDLFLVEVNRGCGRGCFFCAAGHLYRPLRHRGLDGLLRALEEGAAVHNRFGLLGSAVSDHPDITALTGVIVERGWRCAVSSLRLDRLPDALLENLRRAGARTVTLAPETGSERLRRAVNKRISDEQILDAAERTAAAGIERLKLYFLVGLPGEEESDREAIVTLVEGIHRRLLAVGRRRGRLGRVGVSLGCFVPKPWTPFQWHPFAGTAALKAALSPLTRRLRRIPNVTVAGESPRRAWVQALLSRGDRRVGGLLEETAAEGGSWSRSLRGAPVDPAFYVTRQRGRLERFPWEIVDAGLDRERLWRQYRRALGEEA